MECVIVNGISKTRDNILKGIPYREDHSWNAVKMNGKWHLVDVTWANTTSRDGSIDDFYFKTDPYIFILDHYPMDAVWQLIPEPVSLEEFIAFPCYSKKYFQLGFGGYTGDAVSSHRSGAYSIRIGISREWQPVLVAVNSNDREVEEPDTRLSKGAFDYYQSVSFSTGRKIMRIDAVRRENNYILMEIGIVYFELPR
jgi:transglutaminase/protease-like cytokinesis protein 3